MLVLVRERLFSLSRQPSYGLSRQRNAMVAVFLSSPLKYTNMHVLCMLCVLDKAGPKPGLAGVLFLSTVNVTVDIVL